MSNLPDSNERNPKGKFNKDILLGILFAVFIVAAIAAMVVIDTIGQAKLGDASKIHNAVDD